MIAKLSGTPKPKNGKFIQRYFHTDGKQKMKSGKTAAEAKREAQRIVDQLNEIAAGVEALTDEMTFEEFAKEYLAHHTHGTEGRKKLGQSTLRQYNNALNHAKKVLGKIALKDIHRAEMMKLLAHLVGQETLTDVSVNKIMGIVRMALGWAVACEIISAVPGTDAKVSIDFSEVQDKLESRIMTPHQIGKLDTTAFANARSTDLRVRRAYANYFPLYMVLRSTGMRSSEAFGLRYDDFFFDRNPSKNWTQVSIKRSVQPKSNKITEAERFKSTKTKNSRRTIPIPEEIGEMLRRRMDHLNKTRDDLVFETQLGTALQYANVNNRFWKKLCEQAGVPGHGMHDLRHYYASELIAKKIDLKTISVLMGHHSIQFTMDTYGHLIDDGGETSRQVAMEIGNSIRGLERMDTLEARMMAYHPQHAADLIDHRSNHGDLRLEHTRHRS